MLRVVGCITQDHDLRLVALACLVCLLATHTSVRLLNPRHQADQWAGVIRSGTAILAFSVGVWTTHFIGMLAFRPDMPVSFDVPLCVLSLLLSIAGTALAYAIRPRTPDEKAATIASGYSTMP